MLAGGSVSRSPLVAKNVAERTTAIIFGWRTSMQGPCNEGTRGLCTSVVPGFIRRVVVEYLLVDYRVEHS